MRKLFVFIFLLSYSILNSAINEYFFPEELNEDTQVVSYFNSDNLTLEYKYLIHEDNYIVYKQENFGGLILTTKEIYKLINDKVYLYSSLDDFGSTTFYKPLRLVLSSPIEKLLTEATTSFLQQTSIRSGEFFTVDNEYDDCMIVDVINYYRNSKVSNEVYIYAKNIGLINYSFYNEKDELKYNFYLTEQRKEIK